MSLCPLPLKRGRPYLRACNPTAVRVQPYLMKNRSTRGTSQLRQTSLRMDNQDRAAVKAIVDSGWAKNTAGAIRFALKLAADKVAA